VRRWWRDAVRARDEAKQSAAFAQQEKEWAEQETGRAEHEKERAQENFDAAKKTVDELIFDIVQELKEIVGVRALTVQRILETAKRTIDALIRTAPGDLELRRSRSAMLSNFGDLYRHTGDLARALQAYEDRVVRRAWPRGGRSGQCRLAG